MDTLLQDLRFALRQLVRNPGFTAVAVLTLALGIGANAAMFSVVNGVLLRPLPYAEPDALVRIHQVSPEFGVDRGPVSAVDFDDWLARARSFYGMAGYFTGGGILTELDDPVELRTTYVTEGFFDLLGIPVQLGRPLLDDDSREMRRSVVVSDRLWRTTLGADPEVAGRSVRLDGEAYTVVGVAPPDFRFPEPDVDAWRPFSLLTPDDIGPRVRDSRLLSVVARLDSGVETAVAEEEMRSIAASLADEHPASNAQWNDAAVRSLRSEIVGDVDRALVVVLGVVGFILLIACANLANLMLARGAARSREFAVRTALGAGRMRVVRQLLTESAVLAVVGGALGLVLSLWGVQAIVGLGAETLPRVESIAIDAQVLGFTLLLSLFTALLFGLVPAFRAAGSKVHDSLKDGRGTMGSRGGRLRSGLVVAEVALAVLLVVGAGLMARSFLELRSVDPGFDREGTLAVSLRLNLADVPADEMFSHILERRDELVERLGALPGVAAAGAINTLPLRGEGEPFEFTRPDEPVGGVTLRADARYVSPGYIRAMGIPLLRGEPLSDEVVALPIPIHISETAARRYWPGEDALGQSVLARDMEFVITGIVGDVRQIGLDLEPTPAVYFPQAIGPRIATTVILRTEGVEPLALAGPARLAIREIDRNQPIHAIVTLRDVMAESVAQDRLFTLMFALFGGLALALAAIGIYGVLAYTVSQRTAEFGIRMALGARAEDVVRMVLGSGLLLVGGGIVIGTGAALLLSRVLESQLYQIAPTDPLTFVVVPVAMLLVALAASYLPARRATRVDPLIAMKAE
jgi:predicted permease